MTIIVNFIIVTFLSAFRGKCAIDKLDGICTISRIGDQGQTAGGDNLRVHGETNGPHNIDCDGCEICEHNWEPLIDTEKYQGARWDELRSNIVLLLQNEMQSSKLIAWLKNFSMNDYDYTSKTTREPRYTVGPLPQYYMDVLRDSNNYSGAHWTAIRSLASKQINSELEKCDTCQH